MGVVGYEVVIAGAVVLVAAAVDVGCSRDYEGVGPENDAVGADNEGGGGRGKDHPGNHLIIDEVRIMVLWRDGRGRCRCCGGGRGCVWRKVWLMGSLEAGEFIGEGRGKGPREEVTGVMELGLLVRGRLGNADWR